MIAVHHVSSDMSRYGLLLMHCRRNMPAPIESSPRRMPQSSLISKTTKSPQIVPRSATGLLYS